MPVYNGDEFGNNIQGTSSDDVINGDGGDDYLYGYDGSDVIFGNVGNDFAYGGDGQDQLNGNDGNDWLDGGSGADQMFGGGGDDVYIVDNIADQVTENGFFSSKYGMDRVEASVDFTLGNAIEDLLLTGSDNINGTGNVLNNVITGNDGNNRLDGSFGNDTLAGGAGNDTYVVESLGDSVTENAGEGTDTVESSVDYTLGANLENLTLVGGANINGIGNELDNTITGNSGDNLLDGRGGNDTLAGGLGNDTYVIDSGDTVTEYADEGVDTVQFSGTYTLGANVENLILTGTADIDGTGNELNNLLSGNSGINILTGGEGHDTYLVQNAEDQVIEEADQGIDTVQSSLTWTLGANVESLILTGSDNIDGTGNELNNALSGNDGINILTGGAGDDSYYVQNAEDQVVEAAGEGIDTVASSVSWTLGENLEFLSLIGNGNISGTGNELDNLITGNDGNNLLDGRGGNDTLAGGKGNDTYVIDSGDTVAENFDEGVDTVQTSDTYTLGASFENLVLTGTADIDGTGNALDNIITGNDGINILTGLTGNDTYVVQNAEDQVIEEEDQGTDTVRSSITWTLGDNVENLILTGSDNIDGTGNELNNALSGNSGINILTGGAGDDTYYVQNTQDTVIESLDEGYDTVYSSATWAMGANIETLILTGTGNTNGTGNELENTLIGNDGDNVLDGGADKDSMEGGLGDDTYIVDHAGDGVFENVGEGIDTVKASVDHTLADNVENLVLSGTGNINGTGNSLDNVITGNSGNNVLNGGAGVDLLKGGAGDDTYVVGNLDDMVKEVRGGGYDKVESSVSIELGRHIEQVTLTGTDGIEATGNTLDNVFIGNSGDNVIDGGKGSDTVSYETATQGVDVDLQLRDAQNTGAGHDKLINIENLTGSDFSDTLTGNWMDNVLNGGDGNDVLDGGSGNDTLFGELGADTLLGSDGNDLLDGGSDDDILFGGTGNDVLTGGVGADIFVFNSALGAGNVDTVTDFNTVVDTLQLDASIFTKLAGGFSADNFVSSTAGVAADANDYLVYDSDAGKLYYDADGNGAGAAVLFATFSDLAAVNADDFAIV